MVGREGAERWEGGEADEKELGLVECEGEEGRGRSCGDRFAFPLLPVLFPGRSLLLEAVEKVTANTSESQDQWRGPGGGAMKEGEGRRGGRGDEGWRGRAKRVQRTLFQSSPGVARRMLTFLYKATEILRDDDLRRQIFGST